MDIHTPRMLTPEEREAKRSAELKKERRKEMWKAVAYVPLVVFVLASFLSLPVTAIGAVWGWDVRYLVTSTICCAVSLVICMVAAQ